MPFDREWIRTRLAELSANNLFIGTSSWKYPGWRGMLYDDARYVWRGRFAESRFERNCLAEYAEVFKSVCIDAAYYTFPTEKQLKELQSQVPPDFQFGFKVTDEITVRRFPGLARFGIRAGQTNPHFLDAHLFHDAFLKPCESIRPNVGVLIFEFSRFYGSDFAQGRDFVQALDAFLGALPAGWPYAVEMRNRSWLAPEYFQCLNRHGVAHVFNSWDAMPPVSEQMLLPGAFTHPKLLAARFLLKPERRYEEAVQRFQPYDSTKEVCQEAREAGISLLRAGKAAGPDRKTLIFVNNRLEGNALETIAAMVSAEL